LVIGSQYWKTIDVFYAPNAKKQGRKNKKRRKRTLLFPNFEEIFLGLF